MPQPGPKKEVIPYAARDAVAIEQLGFLLDHVESADVLQLCEYGPGCSICARWLRMRPIVMEFFDRDTSW